MFKIILFYVALIMINQDMYIGSFFNTRKVQSYIHSNHIAYGTEVETHDIHAVKRKKKIYAKYTFYCVKDDEQTHMFSK